MPSSTNSHIQIKLGKQSYPATWLSGTEAVSTPFLFHFEFLAPFTFNVRDYPGKQVTLEFNAPDGFKRRVSGLIWLIEETDTRDEKTRLMGIHCHVVPRLSLLKENFDQRIFLGHTAVDITKMILEQHGYKPYQLKFNLGGTPPIHAYTLQVEQNDFDFVHRVLAKDGIFYYFDCETQQDITMETIRFFDATTYCPYLKRGMVRYFPPSGMGQGIKNPAEPNKEYTSLYKLQDHHSLVTGEWGHHDTNDQTPEVELYQTHRSGTDSNLKNPGKHIKFGDGALSLEEIDRQARFAAERAKVKAHHLTASGNIADVAAGRLVSLDASKFQNTLTGDYFITAVSHTLGKPQCSITEFASEEPDPVDSHIKEHTLGRISTLREFPEPTFTSTDPDAGPDYRCDFSLIKRDTPFRPELPEKPEIPLTFTARIESDGKYASLDNQGRYHLRKLLDLGDRQHTQAINPPLRKLQPYAGPMVAPGIPASRDTCASCTSHS